MTSIRSTQWFALSAVALMAVGCTTANADGDAPRVDESPVAPTQTVTSTNADGTWTADAYADWGASVSGTVRGLADFAGPSGKTRRMGVCLLELTAVPCSGGTQSQINAECASSGVVPPGGFRYCTAPEGSGQKYCAIRPGSPSNYCAGTPALGGASVSPGSFSTPAYTVLNGKQYLSYGCFEGCAATDASASSSVTTMCHAAYPTFQDPNGYCEDYSCDGVMDRCYENGFLYVP